MTELSDRPSDKLKIKHKGQERELFMSYLRQNQCLRVLGDPDRLATMTLDPDISEQILIVMLADKPDDFADVAEGDVSNEDYDAIIEWVQAHLSHFLLKRFLQMGRATKSLEPKAAALLSQVVGSLGSNSNEPSAGPSEPSPAA